MQWAFALIIIFFLYDIKDKIKKLDEKLDEKLENNNKNTLNNKKIILEDYLNKDVCIIIKDESEILDQHLFFAGQKNKGKIIDFDNEWIMFKMKKKKENTIYYIKVKDIESIDEIN